LNAFLADTVFAGVLIFCRIGCCLMLLPGFGSARVPIRVRLLVAVGITLALIAFILPEARALAAEGGDDRKVTLLISETINGSLLGLLARLYILALQFSSTLATNMIGLAPTPGAPIDDLEPSPPLVSLVTMAATMVIFAAQLEYKLLGALIESYALLKIGSPLDAGWYLDQFLQKLQATSALGLRLAAPFVVYAVIVNLAIGFANKFTPQISVYFITTGLVTAGGLVLLWFIVDDMYGLFLQEFMAFIG
jgi:flagellar biosynthesis protein FliR